MSSVLSKTKPFGPKRKSRRGTIRRHAEGGSRSKLEPANREAVAAFNEARRRYVNVRAIYRHPSN